MSGWPRGVGSEALSVAPVTELCSPQVGGVTVMTLYSDAPDEKLPAAQSEHAPLPAAANEPGTHSSSAVAPDAHA